MAVEQFDLASLVRIDDGRIRTAWEQAMKRARNDCQDRPGVGKPRKVMLVTTLTPVSAADGTIDTVDVQFEIDDSLPKRASQIYNMKSVANGLLFNEMSPDDVRQGTLDAAAGPREVRDAE